MQIILKGFGFILIVFSGFIVGYLLSIKISNNTKALKDILVIIDFIENNICYKKETTEKILKDLKTNCNLELLSINTDNKFKDCLVDNKDYFYQNQFLVLTEFLDKTGFDIQSIEIKKLNYYKTFFNNELQQAQQKEIKDCKLYRTLGLYAGISIAIFFI